MSAADFSVLDPMNHYETVAEALRYIRANALQQPSLEEIAAHACLSPFHFQRVFSEWAGVSPKKFLQFLTLQHTKAVLNQATPLAAVAQASGLSGTGRLHDLFLQIEGLTPGDYQRQGEQLTLKYTSASCKFGNYLVAATPKGICHLHFYQDEHQALQEFEMIWPKANRVQQKTQLHQDVQTFFETYRQSSSLKLPLHLKGTPFQLKVWEALLRIPEGQLSSYAQMAQGIGSPNASRAVGTAIGSNPIAFLIPCHRVIKSVGGIGEYRWGSERKMAMIGWEAARYNQQEAIAAPHSQLPLFS